MRFLSVIFFIFFITHAYSQQVRVVGYTKYASIKNGRSLKDGDTLSIRNTVVVKQDGELHLINNTGWGFYLNKGTYDLDSCYYVYKNIYQDYDSVKAIIDTIFPDGLNGEFRRSGCTMMSSASGNRQDVNYENGNIAFLHTNGSDLIRTSSDTITIYWRDPQKKSGKYIIEFQNMFDDVIGYRICNGNSFQININEFPGRTYIASTLTVIVYSEDGRKSSRIAIQLKQ
ncbi:hypothetical protein [Cytophaga aurantiaca]|uniref:hypothetical protein n=1 Tax=Cytophaga aurantiaca TaxID=29530 RepID=UPI00036C4FCB|nr:hypothetical protein [Cytophaga aurantiaca]